MKHCISFLSVVFVLLFKVSVCGQNIPKPLNSKFLISEGIDFHDKEMYDSARFYFHQISRNDSLYGTACYEIALGYYAEKNYDSALVYIKKAANSGEMGLTSQSITFMGTVFDDAGLSDSAIACYQTALKLTPYSSKLHYDLGATYYRLDSLDLAEQYLIQAIEINPAYFKATALLGKLNEKKNRRVEALLCYYMADIFNHSAELARWTELYLAGESEITPLIKEYVPVCQSFGKIDEYIDTKIAMSSKYKPIFKSQSAFARQGDILFKYLEYNPKIDNFYMNYFVKVLTFIRDKKQVETCMYAYFSVFNDAKVQKWVKSNASKMQKFYAGVRDEIARLAGRGLVNENQYDGLNYVYSNGVLLEFGKYSDEKNKVKEGLWLFLERDGSISSTLNYKNGKPEGEMNDFNPMGQVTTTIPFVNGIKSGVGKAYHDNGKLSVEAVFENDKIQGKFTRYFLTGQIEREMNYKNGVLNGTNTYYYKNGMIADSVNWTNGKENGMYCAMYPNNQISGKGLFVNDLREGEFIYYYPDGQISSQGNMTKGNTTGKWIDYHPNGAISWICFYNDKGNLTDTSKSFDANGVLQGVYVYSDNGKNNQRTFYRSNGTIYSKEEMKNNNTTKIEMFDNESKSLEATTISNAGTYVKLRNELGNISSEGMIKNGKKEGRWIIYTSLGNIEEITNYKKGELNGTDTTFYANGKIQTIANWKDDKLNGYLCSYNLAGKITIEGYCVDGLKEGYWLRYDNFGNITNKEYYTNDEPDQWQAVYYLNGNLSRENYYNNFVFREIINYDTLGVAYETLTVSDSSCKIVEHYPNGKIMTERHYTGGVLNGELLRFYVNGQKKYSCNLILGKKYGTENNYNEDGKLYKSEEYIGNKLYGKAIYINDDNERTEIKYFNDKAYDTVKDYNNENKLISAVPYMENEKHGLASYYDEHTGELAYQLLFYKDAVIECISPKGNQHIKVENNQKVTTYYANGAKSAEMIFLNGYRDGEQIRYYANGKLLAKYACEVGTYNGQYIEYYNNSNLKEESHYIYDEYDGIVKKYYPNGKLKSEEYYVFGKKHGEQKSYNQQGALVKITYYYYGEIQK